MIAIVYNNRRMKVEKTIERNRLVNNKRLVIINTIILFAFITVVSVGMNKKTNKADSNKIVGFASPVVLMHYDLIEKSVMEWEEEEVDTFEMEENEVEEEHDEIHEEEVIPANDEQEESQSTWQPPVQKKAEPELPIQEEAVPVEKEPSTNEEEPKVNNEVDSNNSEANKGNQDGNENEEEESNNNNEEGEEEEGNNNNSDNKGEVESSENTG